MILKICKELPDIYIITAFIGKAFAGAKANSQDFLSLRVSVSSAVGPFRGCCLEAVERYNVVSIRIQYCRASILCLCYGMYSLEDQE